MPFEKLKQGKMRHGVRCGAAFSGMSEARKCAGSQCSRLAVAGSPYCAECTKARGSKK